ncbi:hypothetical protein [Mycolicibacterium pulveris]|uniref:hypothetical protein n=1 Tax=Mycolicibacterium pulveris TaxID=36813 RepID=UPI003CF8C935
MPQKVWDTGKVWTRHYQIEWEARLTNPAFKDKGPVWMKLVCLAYARHHANGHATFKPGELASILGVPRQRVTEGIAVAVSYGFLSDESCSRCLVVPSHAIQGPQGNVYEPCMVNHKKRSRVTTSVTDTEKTLEENAETPGSGDSLNGSIVQEERFNRAESPNRNGSTVQAGRGSADTEAPDGNTEDDRQPDTVTLDDTEVAMPQADTIEVDPIVWFTEYLSNGPVESIKFSTDCAAMGFRSTDFPVDRFGLATIDGTVHVEDLWNRQQSDLALSAASEQA